MIRVAVAGAAGRMGQTVCAAVEDAEGLELTGRADPALGTSVAGDDQCVSGLVQNPVAVSVLPAGGS